MTVPVSDHWLKLDYGSGSKVVYFTDFAEDTFPIQYLSEVSLDYTPLGTPYSTGPVRKQKKLFTISSYVNYSQWTTLAELFESWDDSRGKGLQTDVLSVSTLLDPTVPKAYRGFFTVPPTLQKMSSGNQSLFIANTTLSEVQS